MLCTVLEMSNTLYNRSIDAISETIKERITHEEKVRKKSLLLKCHINLLVSHSFRKIRGGISAH